MHSGDKGNGGGSSEVEESPGVPEKDGRLHTDIETARYFVARGIFACCFYILY